MQLSQIVIASLAVKMASALSYVTVTQGDATYVEAITELSDLSAPPGAYVTYSLLPLTKGTHSFIKTIWTTVYTNSGEAEATATSEAAEVAATSEAEETSEAVAESSAAEITSAAVSAVTSAVSAVSSVIESAASSAEAEVSSYEAGAKNLGAAAGVVGFAGVAALLI